MADSSRRLVALAAVLTLAFVLRFGLLLALRDPAAPPDRRTTGADGVEFDLLGRRVAAGQGYTWEDGSPTSFRAPGFPLYLAAFHAVSARPYWAIHLSLCLLGTAACLATWLLARELTTPTVALIAALLAALYLPHLYFATRFDSENLFAVCLGFGLWLLLRGLRTQKLWPLAVAGALLGWGTLTRPFAVLLLPLVGGLLVWRLSIRAGSVSDGNTTVADASGSDRYWPAILRPLLAFGVAFLAVLLPWTIRNAVVHGKVVLVATNGGSTFYGGNNDVVASAPTLWGNWVATPGLPGRELVEAEPSEVVRDQLEWRLGQRWVAAHPGTALGLAGAKLIRLALPDLASPRLSYLLLQLAAATPMLMLMGIGLLVSFERERRRSPEWWLVHGTLLATVATAVIFWGSPRFRDANLPILMIYAAVGMSWLWSRFTLRGQRRQTAATIRRERLPLPRREAPTPTGTRPVTAPAATSPVC